MKCKHLSACCEVVKSMCGVQLVPHESACRACSKEPDPRSKNSVTASLAIGAVRGTPAERSVREKHGYLLKKIVVKRSAEEMERELRDVMKGVGAGSELWRMLSSIGIVHKRGCSCLSLARKMNRMRPKDIRENSGELAEQMKKNASEYGWAEIASAVIRAASGAVRGDLPWILKIDPVHPYESLIEIAASRFEGV